MTSLTSTFAIGAGMAQMQRTFPGVGENCRAGRTRAVVVRAKADDAAPAPPRPVPEDSRWVDGPEPPYATLRDRNKKNGPAGWLLGKIAFSGLAAVGASLVVPKQARALPDYAVNGGMAAAGATAAALVIRASANRGDVPATPAATLAEMPELAEFDAADLDAEDSESSAAVAAAEMAAMTPEEALESLSKLELAELILHELPLWQKALLIGSPPAAILAIVYAARRWSYGEILKFKGGLSFGGDAETQRLSAALVEVESKLSVIMDERDEAKADFETWKEDMQAEMEKRDAAAEKKLEAAFAETREVREELQIARAKLESSGLTTAELESAQKMNSELQRQLESLQEASMAEIEVANRAMEDARTELEAALRDASELRARLTKAQTEAERHRGDAERFEGEAERFRADAERYQGEVEEAREKLENAYESAKGEVAEKLASLEGEKDRLEAEKTELAIEKDGALAERDVLASEREKIAGEKESLASELVALASEKDAMASEKDALVTEKDALAGELAETKSSLDETKSALDETKESLESANARLEQIRDAASSEAKELLDDLEDRLRQTQEAKAELEAWREERLEWEQQTKSNFLDVEEELREAKAALEAALADASRAGSETEALEKRLEESEAAFGNAKAQMEEALGARETAESNLAEVRSEYERVVSEVEISQADAKISEEALEEALRDAAALRASLAEAEKAMAEAKDAITELTERNAERDNEIIRELKATHDAQMWSMEENMRALEETMSRTQSIARENADRMMRHNERMGRVMNVKMEDADIPVKFEIVVNTQPGQRVAMVGTWNDWQLESAFPMRWTEGNLWTVTTPVHADDSYEYKYVVIDENDPNPETNTQWQYGNNRTLALQLSLSDEIVLVEVVDSWDPDPSAMPVLLHTLDGEVKEVGSTELLRECVKELRTEQALLDGSANLLVLQEIADSLGGLALPAPGEGQGGKGFKNSTAPRQRGGGGILGDGSSGTSASSASSASTEALEEAAKLRSRGAASPPALAGEEDEGFEADGDGTVATTVATADGDGVAADLDVNGADAEAEAGPR